MLRVKEFHIKENVPNNVSRMLNDVFALCKEFDWSIRAYHERTYVINLIKGEEKMNIYLSTGTVQTAINHPKKGKTQLNRKNVTSNELRDIFKNVRQHTNKGYYLKK